jgi:hypothetical protein
MNEAEMRARLLNVELRAAAIGKLASVDDICLIDTSRFDVEGGTIDARDVAAAVDELLAAKPYLAGGGTTKPGPIGGGPQGAGLVSRGVTRRQLEVMSAEEIAHLDPTAVQLALRSPS